MLVLLFLFLSSPDQASETLRNRIESAIAIGDVSCGDETLACGAQLVNLYTRNQFRPVWHDQLYAALREALVGASRHGLDPNDYHLAQLVRFLEKRQQSATPNLRLTTDLELLASDAFLLYAYHLQRGRVQAEGFYPNWHIDRPGGDLISVLLDASASGQIGQQLEALAPSHAHYRRLQLALDLWRHREHKASWQPLEPGPVLKPGMRHPQVSLLRQRFLPDSAPSDLYDPELVARVTDFQRRHFLDADGMVGEQSREILNYTPKAKIGKIRANLERWRWLPRSFGDRYIMVNTAGFELEVFDLGERTLQMDVIVGKPFRQTPVFDATMRYLVLSPYWQVPPSLAVQDKLPELRKDPGRLQKLGIRVFKGWGEGTEEIDPFSVNWNKVGTSFPYRLRQDPGPLNALGGVKFMFPNRFNVYLHDTPDKQLFAKKVRNFSSGCIRISKPIELAVHLLRDQPAWSRDKIEAVIAKGIETTVNLKVPYQVFILYWTVEVNGEDVFFLPDVYGRDALLIEALDRDPGNNEVSQ